MPFDRHASEVEVIINIYYSLTPFDIFNYPPISYLIIKQAKNIKERVTNFF